MNNQYVEALRSRSCYPAFRAFVSIATILTYLLAIGVFITGFMTQQTVGIVGGVAVALLLIIVAKVGKEASLMVADIADATIDAAANGSNRLFSSSNHKVTNRLRTENNSFLSKQEPGLSSATSTDGLGTCPNCDAVIPLSSGECVKCKASFGIGSTWTVNPLN